MQCVEIFFSLQATCNHYLLNQLANLNPMVSWVTYWSKYFGNF